MRKATFVVTGFLICGAVLFAATEQPLNIKPGVWQVELNVKYSGLPPQAQAMMDQMTAQQKSAMGLEAPSTYKLCVTEKNLNKGWMHGDEKCRWTVVKSTSTDLEVHRDACGAADSAVDLKIHAIDSEHVRATMHGTGTRDGRAVTLDGNYTGKWLTATCPADLH